MRQTEILERLPDVFKEAATGDDPLTALLGVMEQLHAPDEVTLADFGRYVDSRRTPDAFVEYLSAWVDLAWLFLDPPDDPYAEPGRPFPGGLGALRELIAATAREAKWRGTAAGMIRMLETATGVQGYRVEETVLDKEGRPLPFQVRVIAPAGAARYLGLVERIVEHERPAHVIASVALETPGT
jgi:phage tail-like protein